MNIPRQEYPRPQFVRKQWLTLNGEWEFSFDVDSFNKKIIGPLSTKLISQITFNKFCTWNSDGLVL